MSNLITKYLLPLGWLITLTGIFWIWDRALYHKLFYIFLAFPTFLTLVLQPRLLKTLICNPLFIAFGVFSVYILISIAWAVTEDDLPGLLKRPMYVMLLLFSTGIIALHYPARLEQYTRLSALFAVLVAGLSLTYFIVFEMQAGEARLNGYGVLENPLLTAHVLGAFAAFWLATWFQARKAWNPVPIICLVLLGAAIMATGSRTPLIGLTAALGWLLLVGDRRRSLLAVGVAIAVLITVLLIHPDAITQRGLSYRPAIWMESLRQIGEHPWLGHGFGTSMTVVIPGLDFTLADPHNMELGVLYSGGILGLALWMTLYGLAIRFCWVYRSHTAVTIAAAWLVFGFASGLTEGNAFMSRPKEHWFLIWMPMALIYAQSLILWRQERALRK
ncbi:putative lipopolysaccharide biosynthesis protein [Pseudomonas cichorii]|uniref:Lipopolysaccharide biosynthesis protein n=1 Tax=Pseudomonas cichorii TaxID=36746 RepID=A0ABQ1DN93_PSECI|nr:O-antigen polymerase [Pseudomonas cichorii JBC1]GFM79190.1 putative lipopolysaccharide biosynthesis protein [Pseudomonas cichorii]GFM92448.1 putative lipopolysaccharide biosynthesis protein [Pseudomonas cichorii]